MQNQTDHIGNATVLRLALLCITSICAAGVLAKTPAVQDYVAHISNSPALSTGAQLDALVKASAHQNNSAEFISLLRTNNDLDRTATDLSLQAQARGEQTQALLLNPNSFTQQMQKSAYLQPVSLTPSNAINASQWLSEQSTVEGTKTGRPLAMRFADVGFPHIERNKRSADKQYKPYKPLLIATPDKGNPLIASVRCMGLTPAQVAHRAEPYEAVILGLAIRYRVSASLVKAVVSKESCFNHKVTSPAGAYGLMQLMPETAQWLKVKNFKDPIENLEGGVRYLAQLKKRFKSTELALAAYNAGPGNVERYNGIPPFAETEQYVKDVMHFYRGYATATRMANLQSLAIN